MEHWPWGPDEDEKVVQEHRRLGVGEEAGQRLVQKLFSTITPMRTHEMSETFSVSDNHIQRCS